MNAAIRHLPFPEQLISISCKEYRISSQHSIFSTFREQKGDQNSITSHEKEHLAVLIKYTLVI